MKGKVIVRFEYGKEIEVVFSDRYVTFNDFFSKVFELIKMIRGERNGGEE